MSITTYKTQRHLQLTFNFNLISIDIFSVYHSEEPKFQPIPSEFSMALDKLLQTYPKFVAVKDLPLENDDLKLDCSEELFDKGFIMTEKPLSLRESNEEE